MFIAKNKSFVIVALLLLVILAGCQKQDKAESPVPGGKTALVDTTDIPPQVATAPDSMQLEKSRTEIEKRLENLLTLIEQKEKALMYRENKLRDAQADLTLRENELNTKAQQIKSQRNVSWIVLIIGALALIVAFIIVARNRGRGDALKTKVGRQRQKAMDKLEKQLKTWESDINDLKTKANKAKDKTKEEYLKQVDALNKQKDEAKKKLQDLKDASAESWAELKKSVDAAWDELKTSIDKARTKMKS